MKHKSKFKLGAVLLAAAALPFSASAGPLNPSLEFASETFDYTVGDDLDGLNGGSGWDGAWSSGEPVGELFIEAPDFDTWPGTFDTDGLPRALVEDDGLVLNSTSPGDRTATRNLANVPTAQAGDTYWLSTLLLANDSTVSSSDRRIRLDFLDGDGERILQFQMPTDDWENAALWVGDEGPEVQSITSPNAGKQGRWAIAQVDYAGNGDGEVYFWVLDEDDFDGVTDFDNWLPDTNNPTVSFSANDGELGSFDLQTLTLDFGQSPGGNRVDRISLTHIPEPGTYALIGGILALGMVMLRRRLK